MSLYPGAARTRAKTDAMESPACHSTFPLLARLGSPPFLSLLLEATPPRRYGLGMGATKVSCVAPPARPWRPARLGLEPCPIPATIAS